LARYEGEGRGRIELTGTSSQGPVRIPVSASFPARERDNAFVARLWAIRRIGYLTAERRRSGASAEVDEEIRALGQRFGIPTELTSYLVLEPGMERFRDAAMRPEAMRGVAGGTAANQGRDLAGRAASPPPPARMAATTGAQAFESARTSALQRSASTLETAADASANVRNAAGRTFVLRAGVWTDVGDAGADSRLVRVQPFSELYFTLMQEIPELREILALGERVLVHGKRVRIELHPDGATRLGESDLNAIVRDW
jgi:hypothetical protein